MSAPISNAVANSNKTPDQLDDDLRSEAVKFATRWENNNLWDEAQIRKMREEYDNLCKKIDPQLPFFKSQKVLKMIFDTFSVQLTAPSPRPRI
jgi:hypothetical protein